MYDAEIRGDVLGVVNNAMVLTASDGLGKPVFGDYPVAVACKTGTAQTSGLDWDQGGKLQDFISAVYTSA